MIAKTREAKFKKAFRAMKDLLEIPQSKVKPKLNNLLKVFNNDWSHIEADEYSVLVDAIFENDEVQAVEKPKSSAVTKAAAAGAEPSLKIVNAEDKDEVEEEDTEALVRPKRLRRNIEGQSSSLNWCNNGETQALPVKPNEEPSELPETLPHKLSRSQAIVQSPDPNGMNSMVESHATALIENGKRKQTQPKQKSSTTALIKNKIELVKDDGLLLEAPFAIFHPDLSNGKDSSSRDGTNSGNYYSDLSTQSASSPETVSSNKVKNNKLVTVSDENSIGLASSESEVKISMSCNFFHKKPNFRPPSFETVVKTVEEKCLRTYKFLPPNSFLMNIMKDMCQTYLDLGSNSESDPHKTIDVSANIDLLNGSSALDARSLCSSSVKESEIANSNMDSPLLILPVTPPHCDEVDNGCQLNETIVRDPNDTDGRVTDNPSLVIVPDTIRRVHHDVGDVAKGQENISIGLVTGTSGLLPPSFFYIPKSAIFCDANVDLSLSHIGDNDCCFMCSGDCLSSATPCACANGGDFAYTEDGLLKEELLNNFISLNRDQKKECRFFCEECPLEKVKRMHNTESCKGHLLRKIVKECWLKCGCNKKCGNKVVQKGIAHNLQVFMTPDGKGLGLRTLEDLPKGSFVCEYVGEILTVAEFFKRDKQSHPVLLDAGWSGKGVGKEEDALCLDCTYYGNISRFINHRCHDSNMVEVPVAVETPDNYYYHVAFFTTRDVKAMEELNRDYGIDFDDKDNPIKAFHCRCGSTFCRNIK